MGPGVLPMTPKQSDRVLDGLVRHPLGPGGGTGIPKVPHQDHVDIFFFNSQGVEHKEFATERKTINAEFYKGVMARLEIISLCTRMRLPTKLQVFANF